MRGAQENFYKEEVGRLRVELAASTHESEQLRSALSSALDALEEDAIAQRAFWGDDDRLGIAAEAERIYQKTKAALSPKHRGSETARRLGGGTFSVIAGSTSSYGTHNQTQRTLHAAPRRAR